VRDVLRARIWCAIASISLLLVAVLGLGAASLVENWIRRTEWGVNGSQLKFLEGTQYMSQI
jgi:hypothetical protein